MPSIRPISSYRRILMQGLPNILLRRPATDFERESQVVLQRLNFNSRVNIFREAAIYAQTGIVIDVFR